MPPPSLLLSTLFMIITHKYTYTVIHVHTYILSMLWYISITPGSMTSQHGLYECASTHTQLAAQHVHMVHMRGYTNGQGTVLKLICAWT